MPKEENTQPTEIKNEQTQNPQTEEKSPSPQANPKETEVKETVADKKEEVEEEAPQQEKTEELATLQAEIKELKKQNKQSATLATELETMKDTVATKDALIAEYEGVLNAITEAKIKEIPEKFHALIPTNLTLTQKLEWLNTASETGVFKPQETQAPNIEIGKPMNPQPPKADTTKMNAADLMRMAYNTIKK